MAKAVADVRGGEAAAGFVSDDSLIHGFSHLHDSGESLLLLILRSVAFTDKNHFTSGTGGVSFSGLPFC